MRTLRFSSIRLKNSIDIFYIIEAFFSPHSNSSQSPPQLTHPFPLRAILYPFPATVSLHPLTPYPPPPMTQTSTLFNLSLPFKSHSPSFPPHYPSPH